MTSPDKHAQMAVEGRMARRPAYFTHDDDAAASVGHLYYFAPADRTPPPYLRQREVRAIIDIASDGTLAGVELIDDMPPPPRRHLEAFGYSGPAEEHYGTTDLAGWGDIEYPADVQPPEEAA